MVGLKRLLQNPRERPFASGQSSSGSRKSFVELIEFLTNREFFASGGAAEQLLGGNSRQVHARIRINQTESLIGTIRHEPAIHRQTLAETSILECYVA